ncbi:MAG: peptide chain release factor N(5)-glutamine methyltransferase [Chloroflexi bacterium]|nr:peptide chain release factor N(5)-glutamine methyltransferase [Chloroflexota bacterium]
MPPTIRKAIRWGRSVLITAGDGMTDTPALDVDVLIRHVLGCDRTFLLTRDHLTMTHGTWRRFQKLVSRRSTAEPVAYITGTKEFAGLVFRVDRRVLIPRPDTETILDLAISRLAGCGAGATGVDVGTGSGALAIAWAIACPSSTIHAIDIDGGALQVARNNARRLRANLNAAGRSRLRFSRGDGLATFKTTVHVICANLPYIPIGDAPGLDRTVRDWEPHVALFSGPDGLDAYRDLLSHASRLVRPGGSVLMECGDAQTAALSALARERIPSAHVTVHQDLAGRDRVVEALIPKAQREHPRGTLPFP